MSPGRSSQTAFLFYVVSCVFVFSQVSLADVIHVPADQPTIQAGIDAANPGDEVVVADGIYTGPGNKNLDYGGKAITVRSASRNPELCIIDCEGEGRGFYFHSGEGADSILEAVTITHGSVTENSPGGDYAVSGGGMLCEGSSPTVNNCVFTRNQVSTGYEFRSRGGGVCCIRSNMVLNDCKFLDNTASNGGGGMMADSTNPVLTNCIFQGNRSKNGAGLRIDGISLRLTNCVFNRNFGYGVYAEFSGSKFVNCVFRGNDEAGIHSYGARIRVTNCILWDNASPQISHMDAVEPSGPTVTYSLVQDGTGQDWFGTGCIDMDPLFLSGQGYHLSAASPCVDAGTNTPSIPLPAEDIDGGTRIVDGNGDAISKVDMGVHEYDPGYPRMVVSQPKLEFLLHENDQQQQQLEIGNVGGGVVDWTINGVPAWLDSSLTSGQVHPGQSTLLTFSADSTGVAPDQYQAILEITAPQVSGSPLSIPVVLYVGSPRFVPGVYSTIQDAIDAANPADEVVISDGTYTGTGNKDLNFRGKPITVRSASGDASLCIIDCENEGRGFYFHACEGPRSMIDGITIANGRVDGSSQGGNVAYHGGGILCVGSDPTVSNCVLLENWCLCHGGGMHVRCSHPTLINCTFDGNATNNNNLGGGMYTVYHSNPVLKNCVFRGNSARNGGGMTNSFGTSPLLINCLFIENNAITEGGGLFNRNSRPKLINCILLGNTANIASIMSNTWETNARLSNCIIWHNGSGEILNSYDSSLDITYSLIEGGTGEPWFGTGCLDTDPLFVDAVGPDYDVRLNAGSPCIDAGDNLAASGVEFDFTGNLRFVDDPSTEDTGNGAAPIVDMGAYEYQPATGDLDWDGDVDLDDFALFAGCLVGPGVTEVPSGVDPVVFQRADLDHDGDVDLKDFYIFQMEF